MRPLIRLIVVSTVLIVFVSPGYAHRKVEGDVYKAVVNIEGYRGIAKIKIRAIVKAKMSMWRCQEGKAGTLRDTRKCKQKIHNPRFSVDWKADAGLSQEDLNLVVWKHRSSIPSTKSITQHELPQAFKDIFLDVPVLGDVGQLFDKQNCGAMGPQLDGVFNNATKETRKIAKKLAKAVYKQSSNVIPLINQELNLSPPIVEDSSIFDDKDKNAKDKPHGQHCVEINPGGFKACFAPMACFGLDK